MHIDKNIPLPKAKAGKKSKPRFFDDMEVGDSVFFEDRVMAYRLRGSLHNSGMGLGFGGWTNDLCLF